MTRSLNRVFEDPLFVGYGLPKWGFELNHLAYADDTLSSLHLMSILLGDNTDFKVI